MKPAIIGLLLAAGLLVVMLLARPVASATQYPTAVAFGGGEVALGPLDEMSDDERAAIQTMLDANVARLRRQGQLAAPLSAERVSLGWPLAPRDGFTDPGYFGVTGYVDHDAAFPGQVRDYTCGRRTYDTSGGYNHQGTDYFLWPFAWNKMAAGDVRVVAAADGVIVGRREGNPDQSCGSGGQWNAVYVRHADGSIAWYGHLKRDSLTPKPVGAAVTRGEYLGLVGSSGNSGGPHLHFELYAPGGQLMDPYGGSCNPLDGGSWWEQQREYHDPAVNKVMTGTAAVERRTCPAPDVTHESTQFQPGDRIIFTTFYHDQLSSLPSLYRIVAPNGTVYAQWSHSSSTAHMPLSYWYWAYNFPTTVQTGTWRFEVTFNDRTYAHAFTVGQPSTPTLTPIPSATPTITPTPTPSTTPTPWFPTDFVYFPAVTSGNDG
jgi:murein DD-endopeptidase MepM/ murein hydrolase activator NlpD